MEPIRTRRIGVVPAETVRRSIRAALAVTLGAGLTACGSSPTEPADDVGADTGTDATTDASQDTPPDTFPDVPEDPTLDTPPEIDVGPGCLDESDNICPVGCTPNNDRDCCLQQDFCSGWWEYSPNSGCGCAVEGPFAPPSLPLR